MVAVKVIDMACCEILAGVITLGAFRDVHHDLCEVNFK